MCNSTLQTTPNFRLNKLNELIAKDFKLKPKITDKRRNPHIPDRRYRTGYFHLTSFEKKRSFTNRSKKFIEDEIVDRTDPGNQFITVNTFKNQKTRKNDDVFNLMEFYIDLDIYNSDYYKREYNDLYPSDNEHRVNHRLLKKLIKSICKREGIPYPSRIVYSGNGYYLFWKLRAQNITDDEGRYYKGAPKQMRGLYRAVQRQLVKDFLIMGADSSAIDEARVLRAVGSTNTKTGEYVETIYETGKQFDIKEFASQVLPYSYNEAKAYKERKKNEPKKSSYNQSYAQWLLKYLNKIVEAGHVKKGNTNNFMYIYFYALRINDLSEDLGYELHSTFKYQIEDSELRNNVKQANNVKHSMSKQFIREFLRLDEKRNRSTKKKVKHAKLIYKVYETQLQFLSSRKLGDFLKVSKDTALKIKREYERLKYVYEQFLDKELENYTPIFKYKDDQEAFEWIYKYLSLISSLDDYIKWEQEDRC